MKLKEEELKQITDLQQRQASLQSELGHIGLIKMQIEAREIAAKEYHETILGLEKTIAADLQKTYGNGTVDLATGTFNPTEAPT
tara:strand:+ start:841 stop:1092 length:252 start_codon:yes stop_codon:yes gene_type:complete